MASILDSKPEISDVVLFEDWKQYGLCREKATVLVAANTVIGTVLEADGDGTFSNIADAEVALLDPDVAIVIDDVVYDGVTGDRSITILRLGGNQSAGIKEGGLSFEADVTAPNEIIIKAALVATGMKLFTTV